MYYCLIMSIIAIMLQGQIVDAAIFINSADGVYLTKPDLQSAATAPDTVGKKVLVTSVYTIPVGFIWPNDRELKIEKGGSLVINSGTMVFNGPFVAGLYEVFSGAGKVKFGPGSIVGITPSWFSGTDHDKVQKAVNSALNTSDDKIEEYQMVKFDRMYDITGNGPISLNAKSNAWGVDRRVLYLKGDGGGITKRDAGFMFDYSINKSGYVITGDIIVTGLRYSSVAGAGTKVWNADTILRVFSSQCSYKNVDTVVSAATNADPAGYPGLIQSYRFDTEHITGGSGWVFEWVRSADTTIANCLIENRNTVNGGVIRNILGMKKVHNNNLRIVNNLFENIGGTAIRLGSVYNTSIVGNYFESCDRYIDFQTLNNYPSISLSINNNTFTTSAKQIALKVPVILWGKLGLIGKGGAVSQANTTNGALHSLPGATINDNGLVVGIADFSNGPLVTGDISLYKNISENN